MQYWLLPNWKHQQNFLASHILRAACIFSLFHHHISKSTTCSILNLFLEKKRENESYRQEVPFFDCQIRVGDARQRAMHKRKVYHNLKECLLQDRNMYNPLNSSWYLLLYKHLEHQHYIRADKSREVCRGWDFYFALLGSGSCYWCL